MNRTDRLFAIVLELQSKKTTRAQDMAAMFETSLRTIYRDIQSLSQSGVPIVSLPGQGYSITDGYFLPPLSFTSPEATMLALGADFVAQNFDSEYAEAARSASRKIEAVLSDKARREAQEFQRSIRFIAADEARDAKSETLAALRRAIISRRRIRFLYHTRFPQQGSEAKNLREADPLAMVHSFGVWYIVAYCHLRRDTRNFRLDRMSDVKVLDEKFERPADFKMEDHAEDARTVTIRALFDKEASRWVRESPSFYVTAMEDTPTGLLVTMKVRREDEAINWLMSWGSRVRVLEPRSLRRAVIEEARRMIERHEMLT
ncbi:MAG: YafY family protein [Acidobacteriota bacterium]